MVYASAIIQSVGFANTNTSEGVVPLKHIINGCPVYLRGLSAQELDNLIIATELRIAAAEDDKEKLMGELIRRTDNVHQLRLEYEGPSVA